MKKILYVILAAFAVMVAASCEKTSAGLTGITYYPVISLEGPSYMVIDKGSTFVDPGYTADLNGQDVTSSVLVTSDVDTSVSGVYSVKYIAENEDGFCTEVIRTVVVLDPNDPIEGIYVTDPSCNRNGTDYGAAFEILIVGCGEGVYMIEDGLAGWYSIRAGYGSSYKMETFVYIDEDGSVELLDSFIPGWADGLDSLEGSYDFEKGILKYTAVYAETLNFNVTLVKE